MFSLQVMMSGFFALKEVTKQLPLLFHLMQIFFAAKKPVAATQRSCMQNIDGAIMLISGMHY